MSRPGSAAAEQVAWLAYARLGAERAILGTATVPRSSSRLPALLGIVLSVALVAAGSLRHHLAPTVPEDWEQGAVVVLEDSRTMLVSLDGVWHPVTNTTSARLALPHGIDFDPVDLDATLLSGLLIGARIGILGAPDDLRPVSTSTGWLRVCDGAAPSVDIRTWPTPRDDGAVMVTNAGSTYLVVAGRHFTIEPAHRDAFVARWGGSATGVKVPARVSGAWLGLVPSGGGLEMRAPAAAGAPYRGPNPVGARVGQLVRGPEPDQHLIVASDGVVAVDPFAAWVYAATAPDRLGEVLVATASEFATLDEPSRTVRSGDLGVVATWPRAVPVMAAAPCLARSLDGRGSTIVPSTPGTPLGLGAYVVRPGPDEPPVIVTGAGRQWPIGPSPDDVLARLGLADLDPVTIAPQWLSRLPRGPTLTSDAARQPAAVGVADGPPSPP